VVACALAEGIGMTAAAGAARAGESLADERGASWALAAVVAGGLVEGVALGTAQGTVLARWLPGFRRGAFLGATVAVAGLGWAAASAPGVLASDDGGAAPPLPLVLLGAAGLGVVMGGALGAAQSLALPGRAPRRTWVVANAAAWPPTMAVIFLGATTPGAEWPLGAVLALGLATGVAAGTVLGLVSGAFLPRLVAVAPADRESRVPRLC
jgi:hypothetical protein